MHLRKGAVLCRSTLVITNFRYKVEVRNKDLRSQEAVMLRNLDL